jgi:hypothetical protein
MEGERALAKAERRLETTRDRWHEVLDAAETMRTWDHYNHFAESLSLAYGISRDRRHVIDEQQGDEQ